MEDLLKLFSGALSLYFLGQRTKAKIQNKLGGEGVGPSLVVSSQSQNLIFEAKEAQNSFYRTSRFQGIMTVESDVSCCLSIPSTAI